MCAFNYEYAHVYRHRKPWTKASDVCFPPFSSYHKQKQMYFWSQCKRKAEYRVDSGQEVVQKVSALGNMWSQRPHLRRCSVWEGQIQKWGSGKEGSGGLNYRRWRLSITNNTIMASVLASQWRSLKALFKDSRRRGWAQDALGWIMAAEKKDGYERLEGNSTPLINC